MGRSTKRAVVALGGIGVLGALILAALAPRWSEQSLHVGLTSEKRLETSVGNLVIHDSCTGRSVTFRREGEWFCSLYFHGRSRWPTFLGGPTACTVPHPTRWQTLLSGLTDYLNPMPEPVVISEPLDFSLEPPDNVVTIEIQNPTPDEPSPEQ